MSHLVSCLHPKVLTNPYTGEKIVSRCGKCDVCRNTKSSNWVTRLDMEADSHKYTLFATLTYDDCHVNQIVRLPFNYSNSLSTQYYDPESQEVFDLGDVRETFSKKDKDYIQENEIVNTLSKRDFQLFIKRLRYYFDRCEKGALLRYYICGEYGPSTYRPHGHLLLFFDSEKCASKIEILLSKAWTDEYSEPLGIIYDPHFVTGSASQYCASYVNSTSELPRMYLHKGLRPFSLFSKCPALGSLYPSIQEVRKIFDDGDIKFRRFQKSNNTFKDDFFWRSFNDRLYPRCQRFGSLSISDRITLYRLIQGFPPHLTSRQIARRIKAEYIDSTREDWLGLYFNTIAFKKVPCLHSVGQPFELDWRVKDLPFAPNWYFQERDCAVVKSFRKEYKENSLIHFVNVLKRVQHQAQIFNVSIDYYVTKISDYYDKITHKRLVDDYDFQSKYFANNPSWHIIYFDPVFYKKVTTTDYGTWSDFTKSYLNTLFANHIPTRWQKLPYGQFIEVLDIPSYQSLKDYQNLAFLHGKIASDLVKQKKNNDYVLAHADKYKSQLKYQI